ncbi:ATP-binding protein [Cellulomonas sp. ATA003]|uniref:ATP-binding protein n=1 Tax=Cellulomonas sp. ATA003 TaxID=3073064 RepID=UPI0028739CAC|nr:ATP-binding protein [Cellulomonas sp. ATA003]WNB85147.1 ATP-binding protein [Cellulomonas sp. ATA003]
MAQMSYTVEEVFTPTSQATVNFVDRAEIEVRLTNALKTPGKQVVVYGESGSGKSTLLQKTLREIYGAVVTTRCNHSTTFGELLLDAFDQLDAFYTDSRTTELAATTSGSIEAQFLQAKAAVEAAETETVGATARRVVPAQISPQRLGRFLGAKEVCWVIEDFHKVEPGEKLLLAQTLKIFSDLAATFPRLRIVAIGATDTAREVVEYDNEMRNRVAEIHVPLMTPPELEKILTKGGGLLNVRFDKISKQIVSFSSGLASVTHHLALNASRAADITGTQSIQKVLLDGDMEKTLDTYIAESSDTLRARFEQALRRERERKFHNTELTVRAIAAGPFEGMTHAAILASIRQQHSDYPSSNATTYLNKLQDEERGSLIRKSSSGQFRFVDPVLHSYARAVYKIQTAPEPGVSELTVKLDKLISERFQLVWNGADQPKFTITRTRKG